MSLLAVKFGQNGGEGDLRDNLLLVGILEQWGRWQVEREEEEGRRDKLNICLSEDMAAGLTS